MIKDILLVVIGAFVGFISTRIQKRLDKKGKLYIYFRRINAPKNNGWGFIQSCLMIPLCVDLLNTSNINKTVRDFSLYLYFDNRKVKKFTQASMTSNVKNEEVKIYGQVNNRYSFVVGAKSIVTADCLYMLKMQDLDKGDEYNRVVACYYDEDNNKHEYEVMKLEHNKKDNHLFEIDEDWIQLN